MSSAKARLPPRRVADRQEGDIEVSAFVRDMLVDNSVSIVCESRIAGEEYRVSLGMKQIHVCRRTPPIDRVAASIVLGRRGMDGQCTHPDIFLGRERLGVRVATTGKPSRYCGRSVQRNVTGKGIEAGERQVVRMRMCQEKRIDRWQVGDRDARRAYSWQKSPESSTKVRISENADASKLQQQGSVPDVRDAQRLHDSG